MRSFIKFLLVGVINTLVGASVMFFAYNFIGISYWFSSALNYIAGGIVSFFLNKFFTFKNRERSLKQVIYFILTVLICYVIAYGIAKPLMMYLLSGSSVVLQENAAMVAGMIIYTVLNFLAQKFIVFNKNINTEENEET